VRTPGILELEPTDAGIVLHRMPSWARQQHNDVALTLVETMPSGARIEMVTDATLLELDVHLTHVQLGAEPARPAAFDLVIDDEVVELRTTGEGTTIVVDPATGDAEFLPGGPTTVRFDGLPAGSKRVEVWLPQAAAVRLIELRAEGTVQAGAERGRRRWVHYGSSISHCLEAERPTGVWPVVAARLADVDLQSFAFAGQCHLDPFAARMIARQPADLITAKLGINVVNGDTLRERTFVPALHGLLDTVREHHPDVPLLVITPIACPVAEDHPGPTPLIDGRCTVVDRPAALALGSLTLSRIRELEREVVAARQATDANLHLLEGTELFGDGDLDDLPDGLHPNAAGYERMGRRFFELAFTDGGPFAISP